MLINRQEGINLTHLFFQLVTMSLSTPLIYEQFERHPTIRIDLFWRRFGKEGMKPEENQPCKRTEERIHPMFFFQVVHCVCF